jgi:hypothetical protein
MLLLPHAMLTFARFQRLRIHGTLEESTTSQESSTQPGSHAIKNYFEYSTTLCEAAAGAFRLCSVALLMSCNGHRTG